MASPPGSTEAFGGHVWPHTQGTLAWPGGPSLSCLILPICFLCGGMTGDLFGVFKLQNQHFMPVSISREKRGQELSPTVPATRVPPPAPGRRACLHPSPVGRRAEQGVPSAESMGWEPGTTRPLLPAWASGVPTQPASLLLLEPALGKHWARSAPHLPSRPALICLLAA